MKNPMRTCFTEAGSHLHEALLSDTLEWYINESDEIAGDAKGAFSVDRGIPPRLNEVTECVIFY